MATTRIMPLHIGKGRTESQAISDIIDYVANPQKTDNGKLITGYGCDSRTADAEFLLAKRQYIAATGRVRGADDVIAYTTRNLIVTALTPHCAGHRKNCLRCCWTMFWLNGNTGCLRSRSNQPGKLRKN